MKALAMRKAIAASVLAASVWSTPCFADRDGAGEDGAKPDISGTWLVEVTRRDCMSGHALEVFPVMNTFIASGTLIEFGATPMVTPAQRTPGFGNWRHVGQRRFRAVFSLFHLPDGVNIVSLHRVERVITMSNSNRFSARAKVRILDPSGNNEIAVGCATESARRIS
jgi:hypothetical protein